MNPAVAAPSLADELAAIVGDAHVSAAAAELQSLAIDGVVPAAAVTPGSAEEVTAIIALANQRGWCVAPHGGGAQQAIGNIPERIDVLLRTSRLTQVEHHDPGDLTIGVGAGMTLGELDRIVAEHGQMLPMDVLENDTRTVGGLLATAAQGPMRFACGTVRDHCIGIRFVAGDARRVKGGGRVVKNVAGYDLMKLLIGSYGTLGVITSASFKLAPRPRQTVTLAAGFPNSSAALACYEHVASSPLTPMCLELVSPHAKRFLRPAAAPVHPEDYTPPSGPTRSTNWAVFVRAAGSDAVLARYRRDLGQTATREISGPEENTLWRRVAALDAEAAARQRNAMVVQIAVTNTEVAGAIAAVEKTATDYNFVSSIIGRMGAMIALGHAVRRRRFGPARGVATQLGGDRHALPTRGQAPLRCVGNADLRPGFHARHQAEARSQRHFESRTFRGVNARCKMKFKSVALIVHFAFS